MGERVRAVALGWDRGGHLPGEGHQSGAGERVAGEHGAIGGTAYFSATTASGGAELWKSDGTLAGTVQVKDINPGTANSSPSQLINNNWTVFFRRHDRVQRRGAVEEQRDRRGHRDGQGAVQLQQQRECRTSRWRR
jgi:ELWxxDGT repeat protein